MFNNKYTHNTWPAHTEKNAMRLNACEFAIVQIYSERERDYVLEYQVFMYVNAQE